MILNTDVEEIVKEIESGKRDLFDTIKEYMITSLEVEDKIEEVTYRLETEYESQIDELEDEVSDLESTIENQRDNIDNLKYTIEELTVTINNQIREIDKLEFIIMDKDEKISLHELAINSFIEEVEQLKNKIEDLQDEIRNLNELRE
jgi:chromosome segregation ATPase